MRVGSEHIFRRVIIMMADLLALPPAVNPADAPACAERWHEQRIAPIAIAEFGDEAKLEHGARLLRVAGDAGQDVSPLPQPVSMSKRRDGVRVSGTLPVEACHAA